MAKTKHLIYPYKGKQRRFLTKETSLDLIKQIMTNVRLTCLIIILVITPLKVFPVFTIHL